MNYLKLVFRLLLLCLLTEVIILVTDHFLFERKDSDDPNKANKEDFDLDVYEHQNINNPALINQIKKEAELALKYYPELHNDKISFIIKPTSVPLASRPAILPLLFPWLDRRYCIIISTDPPDALKPIMYNKLPNLARIGVLGHEFAHSVYYHDRSNLQIIYTGLLYLNKDFRKNFERATDIETINRGLGKELFQWSLFLQEVKKQHPEIGNTKFIFEDRYLTPEEVIYYTRKKE